MRDPDGLTRDLAAIARGTVGGMPTIKRDALHAFVDRQLFKVESTPVPPDMAQLGHREALTVEEVQALWIGAGIASQIGMALALEPQRFVDPWPGAQDDDDERAVG